VAELARQGGESNKNASGKKNGALDTDSGQPWSMGEEPRPEGKVGNEPTKGKFGAERNRGDAWGSKVLRGERTNLVCEHAMGLSIEGQTQKGGTGGTS